MKTKISPSSSSAQNWYDILPRRFKNQSRNPNYGISHKINVPFRMIMIGNSGSGKSNILLDLLYRFNGTFDQIFLVIPCSHEPLYLFLEEQFKDYPDQFHIYENGNIPNPNDEVFKDNTLQNLIIFDDMITYTKLQPKINQWFIAGRKVGCSTSVIYLSQNYYSIPKTARNQCSHIIIKRISGEKDRAMILREFSSDLTTDQFNKMYAECTKDFGDFLLVNISKNRNEKYQKGFLTPFQI